MTHSAYLDIPFPNIGTGYAQNTLAYSGSQSKQPRKSSKIVLVRRKDENNPTDKNVSRRDLLKQMGDAEFVDAAHVVDVDASRSEKISLFPVERADAKALVEAKGGKITIGPPTAHWCHSVTVTPMALPDACLAQHIAR